MTSGSAPDVGIVGGGIAGLCLAQGLKKFGIPVTLYERDLLNTNYLLGFRLQIRDPGNNALKVCLPPHLYDIFVATSSALPGQMSQLTPQLELIQATRAEAVLDRAARHKSVSRITLLQILEAELGGIVRRGKTFTRYEELPDGSVMLHFADGATATHDVLIGADGANSSIRATLVPHARRIDTQIRRIAGKVELSEEALGWLDPRLTDGVLSISSPEGFNLYITNHQLEYDQSARADGIGVTPEAAEFHPGMLYDNVNSYVMWALSARETALPDDSRLFALNSDELQAFCLEKIAGWHPAVRDLVRRTPSSTIQALPVKSSLPVKPWPTRRVTLSGDAIHSMTYFQAMGANTSLHDGALLTQELAAVKAGRKDLTTAIRDYEAAMLEFGFAAVMTSLNALERSLGITDFADLVST
jgi:2-polyprenyl-6-methoxyphenol hydroxylase-like FAD-dependent oxidoreductase